MMMTALQVIESMIQIQGNIVVDCVPENKFTWTSWCLITPSVKGIRNFKATEWHDWPDSGITPRGDPHTSKVVGVDFILYELSTPIFMHINATSLPMMDLTVDDCWVGSSFDLKASYPVVVDVAWVKVTLQHDINIQHNVL